MGFIQCAMLSLTLQWGVLGAKLAYPEASRGECVDEYNGVLVADPYRWMEEDSEQRQAWIAEQNALTESYFDETPLKEEMVDLLEGLTSVESRDLPRARGGKWFWIQKELINREVLYVGDDFKKGRVLIGPSELSSDGSILLESYFPSSDGKLVAYCTSAGGSDWHTARVRNVETGEDLSDVVEWIKFSKLLWDPKGEGFFYARFDAPPLEQKLTALNTNYKVCYHKLGTGQQEDVLLCSKERGEDQNLYLIPHRVIDKRYLGLEIFDNSTFSVSGFLYKDLADPASPVVKWFEDPGFTYGFIGKTEKEVFLLTNKKGARGSVVAVDVAQLQDCNWKTVIPEGRDLLGSALLVKDRLVCQYLKNGCPKIRVFSLEGQFLYEVKLPKKVCAIEETDTYFEKEVWMKISSPASHPEIYRLDVNTGVLEAVFQPASSAEDFETHQLFYPAKDGTPLLLFVSHKKGLVLDGKNPTLLYSYGGYGNLTSTKPSFAFTKRAWLEMGGVYCVAVIRGGGEYGREPHWASGEKTQRHIDDFIAAAEWLIENGYTSKEHLGIYGASFGGWLMGSCINQRPDLFKAAAIGNGTLDLLRAPYYTIAWTWLTYGSDLFFSLYPLSPYHNVQKGKSYPAVFEIKGEYDDRVVPFHTYKHVAALQNAQAGDAPILLHTGKNQGHMWTGANTLDPLAMMLAFFYRNLTEE